MTNQDQSRNRPDNFDEVVAEAIAQEESEYEELLDRQRRLRFFPEEEISDDKWEEMWKPVHDFLRKGEVDDG
jgi:hypothetical protein